MNLQPKDKSTSTSAWIFILAFIIIWIVVNYIIGGSLLWKCPIYKFTGIKCVGCGGQRAILALFKLNFTEAIYYNAFVFLLIPLILVWLLGKTNVPFIKKAWAWIISPYMIGLLIGLTLAFTILRNTAYWPYY
ncbi:MAG: DUF2752 domain-containing protein [Saprospiraceae bacterium]